MLGTPQKGDGAGGTDQPGTLGRNAAAPFFSGLQASGGVHVLPDGAAQTLGGVHVLPDGAGQTLGGVHVLPDGAGAFFSAANSREAASSEKSDAQNSSVIDPWKNSGGVRIWLLLSRN